MNLIDGGCADVYSLTQACRISHLYHCCCKQGAFAAVLLVMLLWQTLLVAEVLGIIDMQQVTLQAQQVILMPCKIKPLIYLIWQKAVFGCQAATARSQLD